MSNLATIDTSAIEKALIHGDLGSLTQDQRLNYFRTVCDSIGLNPMTKPFEYIELNKKLTLYATRGCTDQLRRIHKISIKITDRKIVGGIYIVTAMATDSDGRVDESTGAVSVDGLKGEYLANAMLKCETKAKRRVTLSICGLGLLDETEINDIPREAKSSPPPENPFRKNDPPALDMSEQMPEDNPQAPEETGGEDVGEYVIKYGKKLNGRKLKDVPVEELKQYVNWLESSALQQNKVLTGLAFDLVVKAREFLNAGDYQ